jgi:glycosyltransferase involved in cell wall biosynthesis
MIVHVHVLCWNEEVLLPYFFRHYETFASKIFVYDNHSNDRSSQIIDAHPKAVRVTYDTGGRIFDSKYVEIKSTAWRESRGVADWVVVVDLDEFIYHPALVRLLMGYKEHGITFPKTSGFEMTTEVTPTGPGQLYEYVKTGVPSRGYAKRAIFNPIIDLTYKPGAHDYTVSGPVVESPSAEIKLLHYRFLGEEFFVRRNAERRARLSEENKKNRWGDHYDNPDSYFRDIFRGMRKLSRKII